MLDQEQRLEILALFAGELRERVANIHQLELAEEGAEARLRSLNAAMRELHSAKGAAASLGLDEIADRAHALEEQLVPLKEGADRERFLAVAGAVIAGAERLLADVDELLANQPGSPTGAAPGVDGGSVRLTVRALDQALDTIDALFSIHYKLEQHTAQLRGLTESLDGAAALARVDNPESAAHAVDELRALRSRARALVNDYTAELLRLELHSRELSAQHRSARLLPISWILPQLERTARERARAEQKQVSFAIDGGSTGIDRSVLEELRAILLHLINNAVDHGIESPAARSSANKPAAGRLHISARASAGRVEISVADDGAGVDRRRVLERASELGLVRGGEAAPDVLDLMFAPGVTTREIATAGSGRGAGLDAVRDAVERLSGTVHAWSEPGRGTRFSLSLPVSLAMQIVLLLEVSGAPSGAIFALPLTAVERSVRFPASALKLVGGREVAVLGDQTLAAVDLGALLGFPAARLDDATRAMHGVIIGTGERRLMLLTQRLLGDREVVVKALPPHVGRPPLVAAATILGDAQVVPILDPQALIAAASEQRAREPAASERKRQQTVLIVDDSVTTRATNKSLLELAGFRVLACADGVEALEALATHECALVVSDINMPRLDGFELTARVRADERLRAIPVLLVTSLDSVEDRKRGALVGATDYLIKRELSRGALVDAVRRFLTEP